MTSEEESMTNRLSTFIIALSEDLALRRAYAEDPEAVMAEHGLSAGDRAALRSGDETTICRAITAAPGAVFAKIVIAPSKGDPAADAARDATFAKLILAPTKGEADPAAVDAPPDAAFSKLIAAPTKGEAEAAVDAPPDATFSKLIAAPTRRCDEAA